jgi:hypothetical protein
MVTHHSVTLAVMPTKHPRIGVVRDPELEEALTLARSRLGPRPAAALVRELALRGAERLSNEDPDWEDPVDWLVREHGASPARARFADVLEPLGPVDPNDPTPGTDALEELRADRI